jgi:hypothetical protein
VVVVVVGVGVGVGVGRVGVEGRGDEVDPKVK